VIVMALMFLNLVAQRRAGRADAAASLLTGR
jgi:hypothetical protein